MENQQNSLLAWVYQSQGKTMEELRHSLLYTTLELEQTRLLVQEEIKVREDQMIQLRDLLNKASKERDEAQERCQRLLLEKKLLLQQQQQHKWQQQRHEQVVVCVTDEEQDVPRKGNDSNNNGLSSSDGEESIVSSSERPMQIQQPPLIQCPSTPQMEKFELGFPGRPLPEKGKLLQAVMKAGPLLQTLLLAGPLPKWRHPPPQLKSSEIPPVLAPVPKLNLLQHDSLTTNSCGNLNRKRGFRNESNSPGETKYQRIVFP